MPQMSPIWWSTLFIMFIASYILYMLYMYFFTMYNESYKNEEMKKEMKNMNWMW